MGQKRRPQVDSYRQRNLIPWNSGWLPPPPWGKFRHNDDCLQRQTNQLEAQHALTCRQDLGGEPGPTRINMVPGSLLEPQSQNVLPGEGCRNPTLAKCVDETHTPKVGDLESSGTPEYLEFDSKGQNTSHWGVLGVIKKVLKCRCPKWPRIGHLDICNPSYGQKKGQKSNWQFDSRPLKVRNRPLPDIRF
jgi:hypothetical protein